jgi:tetratricopeptide (TPR) repeat protein
MTFLSVVVLSVTLASQPQTPDRRAEAERLARSGAYAAALKQFQALAAANPDDIEARLWIGRLHALMGHAERSADVFQSIVATEPQNVEALTGLGLALTTAGRLREAADTLNRAESLAADRAAVLAAQGRLHRAAGRFTLALAYYDRALVIDGSNDEARMARDAMRAERAHRLQASYYFEHFNVDVPDTHAGTIEVNAHVNDSLRVFGLGQHERKLGQDETRAGGGVTWRREGNLRVQAGAMFGGDTLVLPDTETVFDVGYSARSVRWLAGVRYFHFDASSTVVVSPGLVFPINERLFVTLRYYRSKTDFRDVGENTGNSGGVFRGSGHVSRRVWVDAGYVRGFEGLENVTAERFSQLDANTVSAGFRFEATPMTSIGATYEHQWRSDETRVSTALVTLIQRFK